MNTAYQSWCIGSVKVQELGVMLVLHACVLATSSGNSRIDHIASDIPKTTTIFGIHAWLRSSGWVYSTRMYTHTASTRAAATDAIRMRNLHAGRRAAWRDGHRRVLAAAWHGRAPTHARKPAPRFKRNVRVPHQLKPVAADILPQSASKRRWQCPRGPRGLLRYAPALPRGQAGLSPTESISACRGGSRCTLLLLPHQALLLRCARVC